jgi:hypothetical protein
MAGSASSILKRIILSLVALAALFHLPECEARAAGLPVPLELTSEGPAAPEGAVASPRDVRSTRRKRWLINGTIGGIILGYGFVNWWSKDFEGFEFKDEGWFTRDSSNGGADKTGHANSTYISSRVLSALYRHIGVEKRDADWQGPLAAWSFMFLVEVGDAFSQYGFSPTDLAADTAGAALAFFEERYPRVDGLVDYRLEYIPTDGYLDSGELDFTTDYSGMKHLIVFKPSGIERFRDNLLSYVEVHAGYFTRGYTGYDVGHISERSRSLYAGVSLNFSRLFREAGDKYRKLRGPFHVTSKVLEFYQPPYVSLDAVEEFK